MGRLGAVVTTPTPPVTLGMKTTTKPSRHYICQDDQNTFILTSGPDWDALNSWLESNSIDPGNVINEGSTVVEDGSLWLATFTPLEGHTPLFAAKEDSSPGRFEYRVPVTPLPEQII